MLWAAAGTAAAVPVLVLPAPSDPLLPITVHLSGLVLFSLALAFHLAPLVEGEWFAAASLGAAARRALGGVWLIVLIAGATGLVALATSGAYRFDPSLQFLGVLCALDGAGAVAAVVLGVRRWLGPGAAAAAGTAFAAVGVWSMWNYLNTVGFTASGGWLVDGGEIARLVIPFDAGAAVLAVGAFSIGMRRP